jgi:hypothetical protein
MPRALVSLESAANAGGLSNTNLQEDVHDRRSRIRFNSFSVIKAVDASIETHQPAAAPNPLTI